MTIDNLLDLSNEEIHDWINQMINTEPDQKYKLICEEYHKNIENDFNTEWKQKKFKWFFKKRRQNKLRTEIFRCYTAPVFYLIEEIIEETLPQTINDDYFGKFVDIHNIVCD